MAVAFLLKEKELANLDKQTLDQNAHGSHPVQPETL